jgi:hypothetical protein
MIVQYDDFSERVDVEPLLTYRVSPFTVFYFGSTSRYEPYQRDELAARGDVWKQSSRQFFAKFQYMFRL